MDLDSRAQYKLVSVGYNDVNFEEYRRILEVLCPLGERYDHETPEMWCSRVRDPFRKILEENPRILSKNGFITMYGKLYESDSKVHDHPSNYIYYTLVEIIQFGYKSDVRFVSDLRKIGSRISDWKLDPNGSQSEPIGKNYQNTIGTNYHSDARN